MCFRATVLPVFPLVASVSLCSQHFEPPVKSCGSSLCCCHETPRQRRFPLLLFLGQGYFVFPSQQFCLISALLTATPVLCWSLKSGNLYLFFYAAGWTALILAAEKVEICLPQSRLTVIFTCTSTETVVTAEEAVNFSFQLKLVLCKGLWPFLSQGSHFPTPAGVQSLGCFNKL